MSQTGDGEDVAAGFTSTAGELDPNTYGPTREYDRQRFDDACGPVDVVGDTIRSMYLSKECAEFTNEYFASQS